MAHVFEGKKIFEIKNVSGGRYVVGALSIPHLHTETIEPAKYSLNALDRIDAGIRRDELKVNYDVKVESAEEVLNVEHIKSDETSKDAVVYNPNKEFKKTKLIEVEAIESGKSVEVTEGLNDSKAIKVENNSEIFDAKDFLELHWKKIESELKDMTNKDALKHILSVASQLEIKGKKFELIEERLAELK
jgi:hypothetical protein